MKTNAKLNEITGKTVRDWYRWLNEQGCGCCSVVYESDDFYRYSVCMGWHQTDEGWAIAWKIGRQTHNNVCQMDLDVDFEMPYVEETGDVDDTLEIVGGDPWVMQDRSRHWNEIATEMRKAARRVWKDWRRFDEAED